MDEIVGLYQRGVLEHAPYVVLEWNYVDMLLLKVPGTSHLQILLPNDRVTKVSIDNWKDALKSLEKGQLNSKLVFWSE